MFIKLYSVFALKRYHTDKYHDLFWSCNKVVLKAFNSQIITLIVIKSEYNVVTELLRLYHFSRYNNYWSSIQKEKIHIPIWFVILETKLAL